MAQHQGTPSPVEPAVTPVILPVIQPTPQVPPGILQATTRASSRASLRADVPGWGAHVGWDTQIRPFDNAEYDHLPQVKKLRELVQRSFTVPAWLANPIESPEYTKFYRPTGSFRALAEELYDRVSQQPYVKSAPDPSLEDNVAEYLPSIFQITSQLFSLRATFEGFEPMEADRRHQVDTLATLIWDIQSPSFVYRLERQLQIPGPATYPRYPRPDACAFVQMSDNPAFMAAKEVRPALSCFPVFGSAEHNLIYILHWIVEFKRDGDEKDSKRQVVEGLVSALHQRRALGFPDHLVFGTSHHSRTTLEILAATWVRSDSTNPEAHSTGEIHPHSTAPPASGEDDSMDDPLQAINAPDGEPGPSQKPADVDINLTVEDIKKHDKIIVYTIARFSMNDVDHLLRLCLLMRQTRFLLNEYAQQIKRHTRAQISQLSKAAKYIYQWPPPPLPGHGSVTQSVASKRQKLDDPSRDQGDMSVGYYDGSDSESDPEELKSVSDGGLTHTVAGKVARYTLINYAVLGEVDASNVNPYIAQ